MRNPWRMVGAAIVCAGSAMACASAESAELSDANKAVIQAVTDSAVALVNMQPSDYDAYVRQYYAEDAVMLPPNGPAVEGHAGIRAWLGTFPPLTDFRLRTQKVDGAGDLAYVRGRYSLKVHPPGAPVIADSGKYIEIWRRQPNGSWRITDDIYNSDIPLPEPPPPPAPRR